MKSIKTRLAIIFILFFISSVLIAFDRLTISTDKEVSFYELPIKYLDWNGEEVYVEDRIFDILETPYIMSRIYRNDSSEVFLSIVYYSDNKTDFHSPEACLGGEGYSVKFKRKITWQLNNNKIPEISVVFMHHRKGAYEQLVVYYFETNQFRTPSYLSFRLQMIKNQIQFKDNSGALVRISTPIYNNNDMRAAENILKKFISDFAHVLSLSLNSTKKKEIIDSK